MILSFSCFLGSPPWCERSWCPSGTPMERVAPVAPLVGVHEGADPGHVGLEGERHQVEHQADVLARCRRGCRSGRATPVGGRLSAAVSDRAIRSSISRTAVRYSSILRRSLSAQPRCGAAGRRRGRSRGCSSGTARACARSAGERLAGRRREEAVEDQPGVDLLGHRRVGRPPGDVRRVGAAIARVAVARLGRRGRCPARARGTGSAGRSSARRPGRPRRPRGCWPRRS